MPASTSSALELDAARGVPPQIDEVESHEVSTSALTAEQVAAIAPVSDQASEDLSEMPSGDFSTLLDAVEHPLPEPTLSPAEDDAGRALESEVLGLPVVARDEFSTTFADTDGSFIKQLSTDQLNVETTPGEWSEIGTQVTSDRNGLSVDSHPLSPEFSRRADDLNTIRVAVEDHEVSFGLIDAAASKAVVESSSIDTPQDTVRYDEVQPGVSVEYEVEGGGVKEALVLDRVPDYAPVWTWQITSETLLPELREGGLVEFTDDAGATVIHIPTPVAWDSSGEEEKSSDVLINPSVTLENVATSTWKYSISVDPGWLSAAERVFPVYVDPTLESGPSYRHSWKSDGTQYIDQLHVGNTRQGNQNVYWRAFVSFPYSGVPGKFIDEAELGLGYDGYGTISTQSGMIGQATCTSNYYNCVGPDIQGYSLGNGSTWTSGDAVAQHLIGRFASGDNSPTFIIRGNEGGVYSHKRINSAIYIRYWDFPAVTQSAPANGSTGTSLTPTLTASGTTGASGGIAYTFTVSANSNMSSPLWDTGWTSASSVTVPEGKLQPDTTYYWRVTVKDAYDGHLGQSTQRQSGVRSLKTEKVPPTPPEASATPGTIQGNPEVVTTLTPTLEVSSVADADSIPSGGQVTYEFKVATGPDGRAGAVFTSGLIAADADGKVRWTVPEGTLQDGVVYSWVVQPHDGLSKNVYPAWVKKFKVDRRLGSSGPSPFDTAGPVTVNLATGNASLSFASPTVTTLGGEMGMAFTYNSQAVKTATAGLTGAYYSALDSNGNAPTTPNGYTFSGKSPKVVRTDPGVSFNWGNSAAVDALPADHFMVRWTGFIQLPHASSKWKIGVRHDDGVKLNVNGSLILDNWNHGAFPVEWSAEKNYTTNQMSLQLDYYEVTGGAFAELWADDLNDSAPPVIIPADWFSRTPQVLPAGWTSSTPIAGAAAALSSAAVTDGAIVLTEFSGATHTFPKASAGGYSPPPGELGTASLDGLGRVVYTAEDGTVYQFETDGRIGSATPPADSQKPATPILQRTNGVVTAIADPVSYNGTTYTRKVELIYQNDADAPVNSNCDALPPAYALAPAGMLCKIVYPNGTHTSLFYDFFGNLWMIEDPGAERTWFQYSDGLITAVQDSVASDYLLSLPEPPSFDPPRTEITYDADGKVATVTLPAATGAGDRLGKIYDYDTSLRATTVSLAGVANSTSTATYDSKLRNLKTTSPLGVWTRQTWEPERDLVTMTTTSTGSKTTTSYDPIRSLPTTTYGPALSNCFSGSVPAASCTNIVPKSTTSYTTSQGLHAAYYSSTKNLAGQPKVQNLGLIGSANGTIDINWGTAAPAPGVSSDNFSVRLTGLITFPATGQYTLRTTTDDGARVWVDDVLIIDRWTPQAPTDATSTPLTVQAGQTKRIRLEYFEETGGASLQLKWSTPSDSAFTIIPAGALQPNYTAVSEQLTHDSAPSGYAGVTSSDAPSVPVRYEYEKPWLGQVTRKIHGQDPGLTTEYTYEQEGSGGWLRQLSTTPPSGTAAGVTSANTTSQYYGDLEAGPVTCGVPVNTPQFGFLKIATGPTPSSGNPESTQYLYDIMGRTVGTKSATDQDWSCTYFDDRGRVTSRSESGPAGTATRTTTFTYDAADFGALTTSTSGPMAGSPNGSITSTLTNFIGQVTRYEDVWGTVTTYSNDSRTGRLDSVSTKPAGLTATTTSYTRDNDGKVLTVKTGTQTMATVQYQPDNVRIYQVTYLGGVLLNDIDWDLAGRTSELWWRFPGGSGQTASTVSDRVVFSQSGRVLRDWTIAPNESHYSYYEYDGAGRLVDAEIPGHKLSYDYISTPPGCPNTHAGAAGSRGSLVDEFTEPGEDTIATTTNYCYDWADRLLSATVTNPIPSANPVADGVSATEIAYDTRGNTTELADMAFTYDAGNRHTSTAWTNGTTLNLVRDATGRVVSQTTQTATGSPVTTKYLYAGASDKPWASLNGTTLIRHESLPGGATVSTNGTSRQWNYPGVTGNTIAQGLGTGHGGVNLNEPFGQPLDNDNEEDLAIGTNDADNENVVQGLAGWHLSAMKIAFTTGQTTTINMGARLYVPALGRFLQTDPIAGGGVNDYAWPPDPVNSNDLSGKMSADSLVEWMKRGYEVGHNKQGNLVPRPNYAMRVANNWNKIWKNFFDNPQARTWDPVVRALNTGSAGGSGTLCAIVCGELRNDGFGIGVGPRLEYSASANMGLSFNGPTTTTNGIELSCSAAAGIGVYGSVGAYAPDPLGPATAFQGGAGAEFGIGAGCSFMLQFYFF